MKVRNSNDSVHKCSNFLDTIWIPYTKVSILNVLLFRCVFQLFISSLKKVALLFVLQAFKVTFNLVAYYHFISNLLCISTSERMLAYAFAWSTTRRML